MSVDSNQNTRIIRLGLIIAWSLLIIGLTVFVMYQVVANYVITYGSKGELYDQGVELLDKGQYSDALAKAEESIKAKENQAESYLLRANALYALDRQSEAQADLQQVAKVKPQLAFDLHRGAYRLIQDDGAPKDVVRLESLAIAIRPDVPKFYVNRSYAYSDLNQNQKAIDDCTFALSLKPIQEDVATSLLQNRASAKNGAHLYKEALQDSELALQKNKCANDDHFRILNGKVDALIGLKRFTEAIATCDQAIEQIDGDDEKQWLIDFYELKIAAMQGRHDKVLNDSEQITKLKVEYERLKSELAAEEKDTKEQEAQEKDEQEKED